ncbi:MAG: hypothetical protein JNL73_21300 [Anaerolineales bacterium]|nr:hypothetical protein [Anaerolineales bacterium]
MGHDDDLDWSIEEDPDTAAGAIPADGPIGSATVPPIVQSGVPAGCTWLTRRSTLALVGVIIGALGLAAGATWWQGQLQRLAFETQVRAIDSAYRAREREVFDDLIDSATQQAPGLWVSGQARLYVQGAAAQPLAWPALTQTGDANVIEHRALGPDQALTRVLRRYVDPDDPAEGSWQFVTVEAYTRTVGGRWLRLPLPELPERAEERDHLEGAVRWTYSAIDDEAVAALAPLVSDNFVRLCRAGLPCPAEGQLAVDLVAIDADELQLFWSMNTFKDASELLAASWETSGRGANAGHLARLSFAETGVPVGPTEQRAVAREVTIQLLGRWLEIRGQTDGLFHGAAFWGGLGLWTAHQVGVVERPTRSAAAIGLYTNERLWTADRSNAAALREATAVLDVLLESTPRVDATALWAGLADADTPEGWLDQALGRTDSAERLAAINPPIALEVAATGPLDGVLICFDDLFTARWAGWRRDTPAALDVLEPRQAAALGTTANPLALSPDGTRLLTGVGSRVFVLDTAAGRALRLPDAVDATSGQVRWLGNDAVLAATRPGTAPDQIIQLNAEPLTTTPVVGTYNLFLLSRSGRQALNLLITGSTNSLLEIVDFANHTRVSTPYNPQAMAAREYRVDRFWHLSTVDANDTIALGGAQLDPPPGPEPGLFYFADQPDDDLRVQAFAIDSVHARAAISFIDRIGTTRVTILYRLVGIRAFEVSRFSQATAGIPQLAFSADGTVLFLTNGAGEASQSGIDAYSFESATKIGSAPASTPITLEDGITHELLVGQDGLYLNAGDYLAPSVAGYHLAVWNGTDPPRSVGPDGCWLTAARFRP